MKSVFIYFDGKQEVAYLKGVDANYSTVKRQKNLYTPDNGLSQIHTKWL
jgi:hypothetical protein